MRSKIVILLTKLVLICGLVCDEVLELPPERKLSLADLRSLPQKDMVECLAHLGKEQLSNSEADFIWQSIISYHNGIINIPDEVLSVLHWVTTAVTPEDYANITLSNIDVIQNFGLNYNLNEAQLSTLAERVREDFAAKEPEDYTYYDLMAIRQILCAFNRSEIERIHPSAYKEAALAIGKLEHCSAGVMYGFATLAVQRSAFGPPQKWTDGIIKIVGKVVEYLPKELKRDTA